MKLSLHPTQRICGVGAPDDGMKSRETGIVLYCFRTTMLKSKGIFADKVEMHPRSVLTWEFELDNYVLDGMQSQLWKISPVLSRQKMEFVLPREAVFSPSGLENR